MKTLFLSAGLLATTVLTMAASHAQQSTTVVTPPGSTTRVSTKANGDQVISVSVGGKPVEFVDSARPMMTSGRVYVPLRGVVERLGGEVLWDAKSQTVTGGHPGTKSQFRIRVGSNEALLNGEKMALDAPPRVVKGTTYVPLRFVSEALGAGVRWDDTTRTVVITTPDGSQTDITP